MDTESFIIHVKTKDIYGNFVKLLQMVQQLIQNCQKCFVKKNI